MGYLDNAGLAHLWGKIKGYVSTPTKTLTQAEYDALTEAEKQADILYAITDDGGSAGGGTSTGEVYSTEEQRIGTWIDGKPLYQKTFTGTVSSNGAFPNIVIAGVQTWVNGSGWIARSDKYQYPIPAFFSPQDFVGFATQQDGKTIFLTMERL